MGHHLTPFTFSQGYGISLCHLFPLKPAPYTTLPTNQLTPASCRLHSRLGFVQFKLYHLSKKLFKIITEIHRVMIMPWDYIQHCFSWYP